MREMICLAIPAVIHRVAEMEPDAVMLDILAELLLPEEVKSKHDALEGILSQIERVVSSWFGVISHGWPGGVQLLCQSGFLKVLWSPTLTGLIQVCADPLAEGERGKRVQVRHVGAVFETKSERDIQRLIETVNRWGDVFGKLKTIFPEGGQFSLVAMSRGGFKGGDGMLEARLEKGPVSIRISRNWLEIQAQSATMWKKACVQHLRSLLA